MHNPNDGFYFIAEVGLNHDGSLSTAKRIIDASAECGAHAAKLQKRDIATLATDSTLDAPDSRFPHLGSTYREIRETLEFSPEEIVELKEHTENVGLDFMVTPFDVPSLNILEEIGVRLYKIASHGVTNLPLLEAVMSTGKNKVLSSGMCSLEELESAIAILDKSGNTALLHCVSSYPTPASESRLDLIPFLSRHFERAVGYSGHELGFNSTLAAVAAGARILERHITMDRSAPGFDHTLSLDPKQLGEVIARTSEIVSMFGEGEKVVTTKEQTTRRKYQVSLVNTIPLRAGDVLQTENTSFMNPGTGIQPSKANQVIGRKARRDVPAGSVLQLDDFEGAPF